MMKVNAEPLLETILNINQIRFYKKISSYPIYRFEPFAPNRQLKNETGVNQYDRLAQNRSEQNNFVLSQILRSWLQAS